MTEIDADNIEFCMQNTNLQHVIRIHSNFNETWKS